MTYLQHARRHLPGGSDPLPLFAGLPACYVTGDAALPSGSVTGGAKPLPFDTIEINEQGADVFTLNLVSGEVEVTPGFYGLMGEVSFTDATVDWSSYCDFLGLRWGTSTSPDGGAAGHYIYVGASPTKVLLLDTAAFLSVGTSQAFTLSISVDTGASPMPSTVAAVSGAIVRFGDRATITP